jgi:tetratricopeptide (TPR) repeat protein
MMRTFYCRAAEGDVDLPLILLLEGLLYTFLFGGLSLLRRERLSNQFAIEAVALTAMISGLTALTHFPTNPILFLCVVYLVTMRVRLLVDVGNAFAQRGRLARADQLYALALSLWPDQTGRLIVQINQGVSRLQQGALDEAQAIFKDVLQKADQGYLGIKYEAAARYNLGVTYRRKKMDAQAVVEFNAVLDTWPASEYARRARAALEQGRHKNDPLS